MSRTVDLFECSHQLETIDMPDADVRFTHRFYRPPQSDHLRETLLSETSWRHEKITIFGRQCWQPRLMSWHGDPESRYSYSGLTLAPNAWTPTLSRIRQDIEEATGHRFNSVLLNLYRNERDSMGWHSDDEPELGPDPVIASLSLGETRTFRFKHKTNAAQKPISLDLTDGSLLLMAGTTQRHWLHGIGKETRSKAPRINLTFRNIRQLR